MRERTESMIATTSRLARSLRPNALVQVIIPSLDRFHRPIQVAQAKDFVFAMFLEIAAGATALGGEGVWRNGSASPIREPICLVFAHLPSRLSKAATSRFVHRLVAFARWARQDAVLVVVNNRAFLIEPEDASKRRSTVHGEEDQLAVG